MITKFKLFERSLYDIEKSLVEYLDYDTIETYFEDNIEYDIEDYIHMNSNLVWSNIDDDRFVEDWISDIVDNYGMEDFEYEYEDYLENNWSDKKEKIALKLWSYKEDVEIKVLSENEGKVNITANVITVTDKEDYEQEYDITEYHNILVEDEENVEVGTVLAELEYNDDMFTALDDNDYKEIIEKTDGAEKFIEKSTRNRYEGQDAKDILSEFYGDNDSKELYNVIYNYIDEDEIKKDLLNSEDDERIEEFVSSEIFRNINLQREILNNDKYAVIELAELFAQTSGENIADEYEFQKIYIQKYAEEDEHKKATAIKYLNDNFGLDPNIEEEYEDYMWLIDADKFNL